LAQIREFFSSSQGSYQLWSPPSLLFSGYWKFFPLEVKQQQHKVNHLLLIVPYLKMSGTVPPLPICLCGIYRTTVPHNLILDNFILNIANSPNNVNF
jgi:hypothetical protein